MTLNDKIAWMERYGRVTFYCKISNSDPYITWTSHGRVTRFRKGNSELVYKKVIRVTGDTNYALHDLFDAVKNRLFLICRDIQNVV